MMKRPMTIWEHMLWGALLLQVAILILAIRVHLIRRTRPFALLLFACIFLVVARSSWFVLPFGAGFLFRNVEYAQRLAIARWSDRIDVGFQLLCFVFLAAALVSFIREHRHNAKPTI